MHRNYSSPGLGGRVRGTTVATTVSKQQLQNNSCNDSCNNRVGEARLQALDLRLPAGRLPIAPVLQAQDLQLTKWAVGRARLQAQDLRSPSGLTSRVRLQAQDLRSALGSGRRLRAGRDHLKIADRSQTIVYLDRIPTDSNLADDPSRNRMEEANRLGWVIVDPKMPEQIG